VSDINDEIEALYAKLKKEAEETGYFINPDEEFAKALVEGLLINTDRYGYPACPCRLAKGSREADLDIICPCDYRDDDIDEFGACFCALYVSKDVAEGKAQAHSIPDRRAAANSRTNQSNKTLAGSSYPVWRCKVCGYLCAKDNAPGVCPICRATKDRFERFI
jgi:ferredoxin-thioredoxin reductase catalytic subunit